MEAAVSMATIQSTSSVFLKTDALQTIPSSPLHTKPTLVAAKVEVKQDS
jgi:uncharacterized protein (DUF362 family)